MKAQSALCPIKKERQVIFDRNTLTFEVYHNMLSAFALIPPMWYQVPGQTTVKKLKVLVAGTGAGVFSQFLQSHFGE